MGLIDIYMNDWQVNKIWISTKLFHWIFIAHLKWFWMEYLKSTVRLLDFILFLIFGLFLFLTYQGVLIYIYHIAVGWKLELPGATYPPMPDTSVARLHLHNQKHNA